MFPEIGSHDAMTKLPELLRAVQCGHRYTITLRGKPVADLVPSSHSSQGDLQEAVAAMRAFPKIKGVDAEDLSGWIEEGRA